MDIELAFVKRASAPRILAGVTTLDMYRFRLRARKRSGSYSQACCILERISTMAAQGAQKRDLGSTFKPDVKRYLHNQYHRVPPVHCLDRLLSRKTKTLNQSKTGCPPASCLLRKPSQTTPASRAFQLPLVSALLVRMRVERPRPWLLIRSIGR
jgi:hypothetical protein